MNHAMLYLCKSCIVPSFHGSMNMKFHKDDSSKISESLIQFLYNYKHFVCIA